MQQLILFGRESVKLELVIFQLLLRLVFARPLCCQLLFLRQPRDLFFAGKVKTLRLKVLLLDLMLISEAFEENCFEAYFANVSPSISELDAFQSLKLTCNTKDKVSKSNKQIISCRYR